MTKGSLPRGGCCRRSMASRRCVAILACARDEKRSGRAERGARSALNRAREENTVAALRQAVRGANDRAVFLGVYPGNLSALDVLSEISRRVPPDLDVVFEELNIDRQTIRMKVYAKKFESADRLGQELAKFAPFARAQIGSIENDPKRGGKRFTVTISLEKPESTT